MDTKAKTNAIHTLSEILDIINHFHQYLRAISNQFNHNLSWFTSPIDSIKYTTNWKKYIAILSEYVIWETYPKLKGFDDGVNIILRDFRFWNQTCNYRM